MIMLKAIRSKLNKYQFSFQVVLFIALLYVSSAIWYKYGYQYPRGQIHTSSKQLNRLTKQVNTLLSAKNLNIDKVLTEKMLVTPSSVASDVREVLLGRQNLTLVSLNQKPDKHVKLSEILSQVQAANPKKKLVKYTYTLKLLTSYSSFVNVLKDMRSINGIFWISIDYTVSEYPKALVTMTFYSLSKG